MDAVVWSFQGRCFCLVLAQEVGDAAGTFLEVAARQEIIEKNLLETDCFNKRLNFRTSLLSLLCRLL